MARQIVYSEDGVINARIRQKTDTEANWLANDMIILKGEQAFVVNEAGEPINFKIGDGTKTFAELPYWIDYSQAAYIAYTETPVEPIAYTFVGEGTYGSIVVPAGEMGVLGWNGTAWSLDDSITLPTVDTSGLATKDEISTLPELEQSFEFSPNLIDNQKVLSGAYRLSDGTIAETMNAIRTPLIKLDPSKTHVTGSGFDAGAPSQADFSFYWNSNIDSWISGVKGISNVEIPEGTSYIGITITSLTDVGLDPVNNPFKDTMMLNYGGVALPYQPFGAKIDVSKIDGIQPPVQSELNSIDSEIAKIKSDVELIIGGYDIEYEFPVSPLGIVELDTPLTLENTGDYLEFTARIETLTGNNVLRMFGSGSTSVNAFGMYTDLFRLRGDVSGESWTEFVNVPSFDTFHKYKLEVDGSNWNFYVDGILAETKPKTSNFVIDNIGNGYTPSLPFWLKDSVTIKSGSTELVIEGFDLEGENIIKIVTGEGARSFSNVYVSFDPTGYSGREKFTVFVKRPSTGTYTGIYIHHFVGTGNQYDYYRINEADEYSFDGETMTLIDSGILTNGESEFTTMPVGKASHTGGAHGYEMTIAGGLRFYADGKELSLDSAFELRPCSEFFYTELSNIYDSPNGDESPNNPSLVLMEHFKKTTFSLGGYSVNNKVKGKVAEGLLMNYIYLAIVCIGRISASIAVDDFGNEADLTNPTGSEQKLDGTGFRETLYSNPDTGYSTLVRSTSVKPTESEGNPRMWTVTRETQNDAKNYRTNYTFPDDEITLANNEVWEGQFEVEFL